MATNSYSIHDWFGKSLVCRSSPDSVKKWYIHHISRSGGVTWVSDPLYAKPYSRATALRHLRSLRASDPNCDEDY